MNTPSTSNGDTSDLTPEDADQRMLDALLSVAGESAEDRNERIERVLLAVAEPLQNSPSPLVIRRILPLSWLGTAGLVAAVLFAMLVVWPGQTVETAQAAMVRVAEALQAAEHRRYNVTVLTTDGNRLLGTVDVAQGNRFLSQFKSNELLGDTFAVIAGSNGKQYWMLPPLGPAMISDKPFGPLFPIKREGAEPDAELLTLPRALATLKDGYDIAYADAEAPEMMRLIATRNPAKAKSNTIRPVLAIAEVIARHDSGEVVQATFTLDQQIMAGNQLIRSITFTLQPGAQKPNLDWYEHQTHQSGRTVIK